MLALCPVKVGAQPSSPTHSSGSPSTSPVSFVQWDNAHANTHLPWAGFQGWCHLWEMQIHSVFLPDMLHGHKHTELGQARGWYGGNTENAWSVSQDSWFPHLFASNSQGRVSTLKNEK